MRRITDYIPHFLIKRCPKTGRFIQFRFDNIYAKIIFPVVGLFAIVWFLMRVIPKPSRILYPCQQVAAGIGGTFLLQVLGLLTSLSVYQQIKKRMNKKAALGFITSILVMTSITVGLAVTDNESFIPNVTPPEGSNAPMGVAKGLISRSRSLDAGF